MLAFNPPKPGPGFFAGPFVYQTHVVSGKMVDIGLAQHSIVLELTLAERRGVSSNDNKLGLSGTKGLAVGSSQ
jgi:hypothetical protein